MKNKTEAAEEFIDQYINTCIDNNICAPKQICEEALKEINDIEDKLKTLASLRLRQQNLKSVLKNFNHDSIKKKRENFVSNNLSDVEINYTMVQICEYIEQENKPLSPREIINHIGSLENNAEIYTCIKNLGELGIISRDNDRCLIPGANWENRWDLTKKVSNG